MIATGTETRVNIKPNIPIHLLYWTVVVDEIGGNIRFVEDIYQRDPDVLTAINQKPKS